MAAKKIDYEEAVAAVTARICGRPGFPVTWQNCERIARDMLKHLLPKDNR